MGGARCILQAITPIFIFGGEGGVSNHLPISLSLATILHTHPSIAQFRILVSGLRVLRMSRRIRSVVYSWNGQGLCASHSRIID